MSGNASAIRAGKAFVEAGWDDSGAIAGMKRFEGKLKNFSKAISEIGKSAVLAGGGLLGSAALPTKVFASYEQALADLRASANPTAEQFEKVKASIEAVSASTGKDQTSVTSAFTELLKAGMDVETVMGGAAEAVVRFARVGEISVPEAASAVNDALNVFKKDGLSAADAADVLSKAADASSISIAQIVQAFAASSASYGGAGMKMNELASAVAILGNAGIKGSDAGTSLKTMLDMLRAPTDEAASLIKTLGINVRDASGQMKPMRGIIEELAAKLGRLDTVSKDVAIKQLFGSDAKRAAETLLNQGVAGWDDFQEKLKGSLSVAEKFRIQGETMEGGFGAATAAAGRLAITIGEAFAGPVAAAINQIRAVVDAVAAWAKQNGELMTAIGGAAVSIGLWAGGIGAAALALGKVASIAASAISALRSVSMALVAIGTSPAGLTLMAIAGAAAVLGYQSMSASAALHNFSTEAERLAAAGQRSRRVDEERMRRLEQLAGAERLNGAEMKEAADIIGKLESKYGDLGVTLDATTGKINGATAAHSKLNQVMRDQAIREAKFAVAEAEANARLAEQNLKSENTSGVGAGLGWMWKRFNETVFDAPMPEGPSEAQTSQRTAELKLRQAREKLRFLEDVSKGMFDDEGKPPTAADKAAADAAKIRLKTLDDAKKAGADLAKLDAEWAEAHRSDLEKEIAKIREDAGERKRLIDVQIAAAKMRGKLDQVSMLEKRKAGVDRGATKDEAQARARAGKEEFKKFWEYTDKRRAMQSGLAAAEAQQAITEAERLVEKMKAAGDVGGKKRAKDDLRAKQLALASINADDFQREQLRGLKEIFKESSPEYAEAAARIESLADRMRKNAPDDLQRVQQSTVGTFSAVAASLLGNRDDAAGRTAKSAEGIFKAVEEMKGTLQRALSWR